MDSEFIGYVGPPDLHDSRIIKIEKVQDNLKVHVKSPEGKQFILEFLGVTNHTANQPEGMLLYALSEMHSTKGLRKFVFVNWDDADTADLEIVAAEFRVVENQKV